VVIGVGGGQVIPGDQLIDGGGVRWATWNRELILLCCDRELVL